MSSNYSTNINKREIHEENVCHIFRTILSGPNSTINHFIENNKDYWYTGTEVQEVELIQNASNK